MFADKAACAQGSLLNCELKRPAQERIAAFKRLCDPAPWAAILRRNIAEGQLTPSPTSNGRG
jgi:hypothetical protein